MFKIIKITVLSVLVLALSILMYVLIQDKDNSYLDVFSYTSELILEKEYSDEDIDSFDITTDAADVIMKESDVDAISVKIYGNKKDDIVVNAKDGNLYISNDNSINICLFFCMVSSKIEVTVPKEKYNTLKVEIASGDIDLNDLIFNNVNISSKSGNIDLNKTSNADIDLVSGDINFKEIDIAKLVTVSGNIRGNAVNDLTTKTISGDVRILSHNDIYIDASTISGNVNIEKNNRFSKIELKISTTSGNVNVFK